MKKRLLLIAALALLAGGAWWYLYGGIDVSGKLTEIEQRLEEVAKQASQANISAPPPLRGGSNAPAARLTQNGVLKFTNAARAADGASPLALNAQLNAAAKMKLDDLFAKQYFEHVSPDGLGPADLAERAGYAYIMVGENLALGNFKDDQELVQAWMDSPGHRANILERKFTEIGIAVGQGLYEGRKTWIAVQEFGRPQAACPRPDTALSAQIEADKAELGALKQEADRLRQEIEDSPKPRTREERDAYNAKVDQYNELAKRINALISRIQGEITVYNGQVQAYNTCATS